MPAIESGPPEEGTYNHVLQRYDKAPNISIIYPGYDETVNSRAVKFKGEVAQTIFVRSGVVAHRATREGWTDITQEWFASKEDKITTLSHDASMIRAFLKKGGVHPRRIILEETGVNAALFNKAIQTLIEMDEVYRLGVGKNTTYRAV